MALSSKAGITPAPTNDDLPEPEAPTTAMKRHLESDSLLNTHKREFDEGVEVRDIIQTADQGIAVLAGIYTLGKYKRPLLYKMPPTLFVPEEE